MAITPVPPMMATLASMLPVGRDWSYEVKWDGYRAQLVKDGPRVRLISRNLKDLTAAFQSRRIGESRTYACLNERV